MTEVSLYHPSLEISIGWEKARPWPAILLAVDNGMLVAQFEDKNGNPYVIGSTNIRDGQWHHIAGIRDSAVGEIRLY